VTTGVRTTPCRPCSGASYTWNRDRPGGRSCTLTDYRVAIGGGAAPAVPAGLQLTRPFSAGERHTAGAKLVSGCRRGHRVPDPARVPCKGPARGLEFRSPTPLVVWSRVEATPVQHAVVPRPAISASGDDGAPLPSWCAGEVENGLGNVVVLIDP